MGGGDQKVITSLFGSKIMNFLCFYVKPEKCFQVPTAWGLYGVEWDER